MACSRFLVVTACAALLASAANASAESSPESLGRMIDQAVALVPPCVGLAIGATQGDVRAQRFYGDTGNHGPPKADTIFGIGSITKTMTATLLAFADQQGTMHFNDPLTRYAPPGYHVPDFNGQPILLAHLAEHTSGLPRVVPNPQAPMPPERLWRFTDSYQLARPPGEQFLYSNLGYALLARAIVRQLRGSEDQLYARIVTGPLGLHDTAIELTPAQHARLAQGFLPNRQPAPEFGPAFPAMAGAGGVRSTLNDMMRYLDFELGRLDVPLRSLLPVLHQPRHAAGPNGSVGLGWQMRDGPHGRVIFKDGALAGYASYMVFVPAQATGVVVLSNQGECAVEKIAGQIMGELSGAQPMDVPPSDGNSSTAQPVELPLRKAEKLPIFSVPVRVGSTVIETGVDTGSTGLRVLPNVLKAQDAQAGETPEVYSYTSGIKIDGVVGTAEIAFGKRAGQGFIQMIRTVGCVPRQPNCPATRVGGVEHYGIMGQGIPDAGFKAIAGLGFAPPRPGKPGQPLEEIGVSRFLIELPREGNAKGRLVLDPAPGDTQNFVELPNAQNESGEANTNRVPGCLVNLTNNQSICGSMLLDTGAPGISASGPGVANADWPAGTPGRIVFGDGHGRVLASEDFTAGPKQFSHVHTTSAGPEQKQASMSIGLTPYLAFSVLYDLKRHTIALRPRPPAAGMPAGRVP